MRRLLHPLPVCPFCVVCAGFSFLFFAFFCLTFASQKFFHLSLRPRRASTFFRKESRQRFAKGLRPFEPHSCALRPFFPSSALLAGLSGPSGRKPPADKGNARKAKEQSSAFRAFLCVGERSAPRYSFQNGSLVRAFARQVSSPPQGTEVRLSPCPGKQKRNAGPNPERTACVRGAGKKKTGCANCPAQPRDLLAAGAQER